MPTYTSIHWPLILKVQSDIAGMTTGVTPRLAGVPTANVLARKVPYMLDFTQVTPLPVGKSAWPAIVCCYWDVEGITPFDNKTDDWMFPVLVVLGKFDDDPNAGADDFKGWRENIMQFFSHPPGGYAITQPAVQFYDVEAVPGPLIDPGKWLEAGAVAGSIGLKFYTRRDRG